MHDATSHVLVANSQKYSGQYVTTKDWDSKEVVSFSVSAKDAYRSAQAQGVEDPVIIYVPSDEDLIRHI